MTINFNYPLSRQLIEFCRQHQITIAVAESCSGGYLSQSLTAIPGSSDVFDCGFITYSNTAKIHCLNVDPSELQEHGAVSEPVAAAMARGTLMNSNADITLSVTGIAGPTGGNDEKPIGTVWFGLAQRDPELLETQCQIFSSGRKHIQRKASQFALEWLITRCYQLKTT
ncbi:MAG: damage-inducible protein CinA [Coxiellaceae bacterium]|nr:damage-inducible protein CinA [Coxiellaceae bacterium]|tara:strand:+ start:2364 stop:2870 length:507 start_codon:yes stop_codon:yes gene_type:complete